MKHPLSLIPLLLTLVTCAVFTWVPCAWAQQTSTAAQAETVDYTVQAGDSLRLIAQRLFKYGGDWQTLRELNGIATGTQNLLQPGQVLKLRREWLEPPPPQPTQATVTTSGAGVSITRSGTAQLAKAGDPLQEGTTIRTGDQGVTFTLGDGTKAQVGPNATVEVAQLRKDGVTGQIRTLLRLVAGAINVNVSKLMNPGANRMVINTATSTLGVRGTVFRVSADDTTTTGEVLQGNVALDAAGAAVSLPAGFGSKATGNTPPIAPVPLLVAPAQFNRLPYYESNSAASRFPGRFEWEPVQGAIRYRIEIASDAQFDQVFATQETPTTRADFDALPKGFSHVRVRAVDVNGLGGYDLALGFRM